MIQFEIIKSPDLDIYGQFTLFQNQIYIGSDKGDLLVRDPEVHSTHVMIEVVDQELIIHPQPQVSFYLIDGKRATSIRKIKSGQIIRLGKTEIKILNFKETTFVSKKNILDVKFANLTENNPVRMSVIEALAQLMK